MTSYKLEVEKDPGEDDLRGGGFLQDIEQLSKALYLHTPPEDLYTSFNHQLKSKSKVVLEDFPYKNKKSSIWKWKPLKALNHFRNHRFYCCFFLHVHSIKGLPLNFNDLSLCVNWKRKDVAMRTRSSRVNQGIAEFEETLMHQCSVYGNGNGPQHSAKYQPKLFLLNASVNGAPKLDLGSHWVDLTRLLPLTLEELEEQEEEKRTSEKWVTSFKLSGKAKGATIYVSFCFSLLGDNSVDPSCFVKLPHKPPALHHFGDSVRISTAAMLSRLDSRPRNSSSRGHNPSLSRNITRVEEICSDRKLELAHGDVGRHRSKSVHEPRLDGESRTYDDSEITVVGDIRELSLKEELELEEDKANASSNHSIVETIDVAEIFKDIGMVYDVSIDLESKLKVNGDNTDESEKSSVEELESVLREYLTSDSAVLDSTLDTCEFVRQDSYVSRTSSFKQGKMVRSLSLDDLTESIADDFLRMLAIENDKDSHNELESPRERLLRQFEEESLISGNSMFDFNATGKDPMDFSFITTTCHGKVACYDDFDLPLVSKEGEEQRVTQSLRSKRNLKILENLETEALMKKWDLDENDFWNSPHISSGGFGSPVHILAERPSEKIPPLGEGFGPIVRIKDGGFLKSMDPFLFKNAKNGARLVMQVSRSVVLPSAMGSSVVDIFEYWASEGVEKMCKQASELMPLEDITGKTIQQVSSENECGSDVLQRHDFLGKQETADNNEIDSGYVSAEYLISSVLAKTEIFSVEGLKIQSNMSKKEASSSIKPHQSNAKSGDIINMYLTFHEWMKLDAEDFIHENETTNEEISQILAAHHAKRFTLALRLQLRDPLRNYEMVGNSMLALIQVERIHIPIQEDEEEEEEEESGSPMFKILEIHVAGLNVESRDKQTWMNGRQQQSGTRWLLSSGMGVSNSKAIIVSSTKASKKVELEDILWSISSNSQGLQVRNPDIVFP